MSRNVPLVAAIAGLIGVALLLSPGASAVGPAIGGCPVLPADNVWNTPIDTLPVDARSSSYISTIGASTGLKADFGSGLWDGGPIGIPYVTVTGSQTKYPVNFEYDDESDPGPYAAPLNAPIEGGSQADGDRHVISIDTTNCILYELFAAYPGSNSWDAGSGAIYDLDSNVLRPDTWTSADAAGLPIFPGLVRYDEILAGEINHAVSRCRRRAAPTSGPPATKPPASPAHSTRPWVNASASRPASTSAATPPPTRSSFAR